MNLRIFYALMMIVLFSFATTSALAQKDNSTRRGKAKAAASKTMKKGKKPKARKGKKAVEREKEEADPLDDTSTSFDFDETLLEGKFKAPSGMVLKGRVQQSKSQMVQLRKNFRPDLRKSSAAVRAIRPRD